DPDFPAMEMADFALGGSAKPRQLERLRQKGGLSYGAGAMMPSDADDKTSLFLAFAVGAPQHAVNAVSAMLEELTTLLQTETDTEELMEAKQADGAYRETHLAQDEVVANLRDESLLVGRKLDYYDKTMAPVQGLTPQQITAAFTKYVKLDALVKVKAGDIKN